MGSAGKEEEEEEWGEDVEGDETPSTDPPLVVVSLPCCSLVS